jgi:benzoyl-CoA-dihydrodiol lyase
MLVDDGSSSVSLPEIPLLAVLPGTGGLVRVVDKRKVRRDRADLFCTTEEGVRGKRAVEWGLVDELVPRSQWGERVAERAAILSGSGSVATPAKAIALPPIDREISSDQNDVTYKHVSARIDRDARIAHITVRAPDDATPLALAALDELGADYWPLSLARALDDLMLHLRFNEPTIGLWTIRTTEGAGAAISAMDKALEDNRNDWRAREIRLLWKRVLKRLDLSARSVFALVEPGSCFAGTLLELAFAADRVYMLDGELEGSNLPSAEIMLSEANFGAYPMSSGLTRLETRFLDQPAVLERARAMIGQGLDAEAADAFGFVTAIPDDIDWEDEIRIACEERAAFSPDALTAMEACLRHPGPETMESKIFGRLTAWQNWIFQRPNATGADGALQRYGSGRPADFDIGRT